MVSETVSLATDEGIVFTQHVSVSELMNVVASTMSYCCHECCNHYNCHGNNKLHTIVGPQLVMKCILVCLRTTAITVN